MGPSAGAAVGKRARGGTVVEELLEKESEDKVKETLEDEVLEWTEDWL